MRFPHCFLHLIKNFWLSRWNKYFQNTKHKKIRNKIKIYLHMINLWQLHQVKDHGKHCKKWVGCVYKNTNDGLHLVSLSAHSTNKHNKNINITHFKSYFMHRKSIQSKNQPILYLHYINKLINFLLHAER